MRKISALIPARGGSKGVHKKNIKRLHGYPLISYSILACKMSRMIDRIIVSTDDEEIAKVSLEYGAEVPFLRPKELAQDTSTDREVIQHYFNEIGGEDVVYIRPTTPLRDPKVIDENIQIYFEDQVFRSTGIRSIHEFPESPHKMFQLDELGFCRGFFKDFNGIKNYTNLPRQMFPKAYQPNGYLDIVKKSTLMAGDTFGDDILPIITEFVIEVDSPFQFELLEYQLSSNGHLLLDELEND
jgi:CMP-N-acetylneuraminic acid synthetase